MSKTFFPMSHSFTHYQICGINFKDLFQFLNVQVSIYKKMYPKLIKIDEEYF